MVSDFTLVLDFGDITLTSTSGKSSLFRILGGLWPVYGGKVQKPANEDIFYVPQRPYLSKGTLRQQILYPDNLLDMRAKGITDQHIIEIMKKLGLESLLQLSASSSRQTHDASEPSSPLELRSSVQAQSHDSAGLDVEQEWPDALSTGFQQRIAAARLFYHAPKYAILDECTSSLTPEVEKIMYDEAKRLGITLMTVSHRRSLWRYHGWILQFDGVGGHVFTRLDAEKRLGLEDEREELEIKLRAVEEWKKRVEELEIGERKSVA